MLHSTPSYVLHFSRIFFYQNRGNVIDIYAVRFRWCSIDKRRSQKGNGIRIHFVLEEEARGRPRESDRIPADLFIR